MNKNVSTEYAQGTN